MGDKDRLLYIRIMAQDRASPAMREVAALTLTRSVKVPGWVARWWFCIRYRAQAGEIGGPSDGA